MTRFAGLCLLGLTLTVRPASAQTAPAARELGRLSRSLESAVSKVAPAVVQIRVTAYGPVSGGATAPGALIGTQRSTGSGGVLGADGFIVTNAHVIEAGRRFVVVLPRPAIAGMPGRSAL